jgi:putative endonuclease
MTGRDRIDLGKRGEELAAERLRALGYRILARNVRSRYGELDVIALDGSCYVFVEVRTRRSQQMAPEESITAVKRRRLAGLAMRYLQKENHESAEWRVDVVVIELDERGAVQRYEHLISAVEE